MPDPQGQRYWDHIYNTRAATEVSWFQQYPGTSMRFLDEFKLPPGANIIDIGGGDSRFADALLERGYHQVSVLDISAKAIEKAKERLGEKSAKVHWIVSDVTGFQPVGKFDYWHDRAAFHFLTREDEINKYVAIASQAVTPGGFLTVGAFSEEGPKKCSGLEIKQYSALSLSARFEGAFERMNCITEDHITPFNTKQNFVFCSFRRTAHTV